MKVWVDVPSGWRWGFPKVWDTVNDSPLSVWIREQGYGEESPPDHYRMWSAESGDGDER